MNQKERCSQTIYADKPAWARLEGCLLCNKIKRRDRVQNKSSHRQTFKLKTCSKWPFDFFWLV